MKIVCPTVCPGAEIAWIHTEQDCDQQDDEAQAAAANRDGTASAESTTATTPVLDLRRVK